MFITALLLVIIPKLKCQDISPLVDVKTLSELPLNKLLQVQNTFKEPEVMEIEEKSDPVPSSPEALALHSKRKPSERGGYHTVHHYEESSKKSSSKNKVQSIFQISVTTLAFLAFGGYLLCLLVQAIKGKTTTTVTMMDMMTTMAPMMAAPVAFIRPIRPRPVRRRRPNRRPVKLQKPPRQHKRRPGARPKREIWPEADPENMYYALVHLSEAYASYHTIDYRKFNYTSSSYVN